MKKLFIISTLFFFSATVLFGQDDDKSFRFGLKVVPSVNWYKPDDKKKFESDGSVLKFAYGLSTDFKLAGVAWFSTGLQVDYDGGKIKYLDTVGYFINKDGDIFEPKDTAANPGYAIHKLESRTFKATYVTLPLTLRFRTKEIGMMTYFGQFGFPLSFKLKGRADDQTRKVNTQGGFDAISKVEDLDISKDMGFMNMGLTIGGGAEYNLSGSTSLQFGLNFTQGFMNIVRGNSKHLLNDATPQPQALSQLFRTRNIGLTVGILF